MAIQGMHGFSDDHQVDFALGSISGIRIWERAGQDLLKGSYGMTWPSATLEAVCDAGHESPPVLGCGCGIWAYWRDHDRYSADVIGVIEGHGRVLIGSKGFRCQKAVIRALMVGSPRFSDPKPSPPKCPLQAPRKPQAPQWVAAPSAVTPVMFRMAGVRNLPVNDPDAARRAEKEYKRQLADYLWRSRRWEKHELPRLTEEHEKALADWEQRKRQFEEEIPSSASVISERYQVPVFKNVETMLAEFPVPRSYEEAA